MADGKLVFAVPSKGRLMEQTTELLAARGLTLRKTAHARGYRAGFDELPDVEVALISASEIATLLRTGAVHFGVTGEDLVRETMTDADACVTLVSPLGFGQADVVVAIPNFWLDVRTMADIDTIAGPFRARHGRRLRVATKYVNLTRRYFAAHGVTDYLVVESLGATEGTPASGTADLIVDITSTGETLRANGLRILDDGVILRSQANLVRSKAATWSGPLAAIAADIEARFKSAR